MPGQYIDIGFVYPFINKERQQAEIDSLIHYIHNWDLTIKKLIACEDPDGEEYIELDSIDQINESTIGKAFLDMYNGMLTIDLKLVFEPISDILVYVEKGEGKLDGYYCIFISVKGDQLIRDCNLMGPEVYVEPINEYINAITNKIITLMVDFYGYSQYSYAFCDTEAQMECTPDELAQIQNEVYSVVVVLNKNALETKLEVKKSKWNIDGFSLRHETA